jgi:hypothetical protein
LLVCVAAAINPPGGAVEPPLLPILFLVGGLLAGRQILSEAMRLLYLTQRREVIKQQAVHNNAGDE